MTDTSTPTVTFVDTIPSAARGRRPRGWGDEIAAQVRQSSQPARVTDFPTPRAAYTLAGRVRHGRGPWAADDTGEFRATIRAPKDADPQVFIWFERFEDTDTVPVV